MQAGLQKNQFRTKKGSIEAFRYNLTESYFFYICNDFQTHSSPQLHGCEIWVKIDGDAPKDVSELTYLTTHTDSPYVIHYDGTKTGKMAHHWFRWVNNRGQAGPWSIVFSAMINS